MKTPKQRFLENKAAVSAHLDYSASTAFQAASDAAMLQLIAELDASPEPHLSSASHHFVMGARRYAALLASIAETPLPQPSRGRGDNLNQH